MSAKLAFSSPQGLEFGSLHPSQVAVSQFSVTPAKESHAFGLWDNCTNPYVLIHRDMATIKNKMFLSLLNKKVGKT